MSNTQQLEAEVAVIGGSFGGVAAAISLTRRGRKVVLTEQYPWIGGQVTSQALCVADDYTDPCSEGVGMNRTYVEFRERIRDYYKSKYTLSAFGKSQLNFVPGNAACSSLTADPDVAHGVLLDMLSDAIQLGNLRIITNVVPVAAEVDDQRIESVTVAQPGELNSATQIRAEFFLDGTDCGDTFPLIGVPYHTGIDARSDFGEPSAPLEADPEAIQSFTFCAMAEFCEGENHTLDKPDDYEYWKSKNPFFLDAVFGTPKRTTGFFEHRYFHGGMRMSPAWFYRTTVDPANFSGPNAPKPRCVINVSCNDYHFDTFLEKDNADQVLDQARALTRAYIYWLQTEAPRDDGGQGYPEIRLLPEITGTEDGLAQAPYIREGRRLNGYTHVIEQDIVTEFQQGARAKRFDDSIGLGCFAVDIHRCVNRPGMNRSSKPYQVPLGAMLSPQLSNFAVAGKPIATTHITNGAYRLHPIEWAIGEAAGQFADFCMTRQIESKPLAGRMLMDYHRQLIQSGEAVYWYEDLREDHPAFEAAQLLAITNLWPGATDHLRLDPEHSVVKITQDFKFRCNRIGLYQPEVLQFMETHLTCHSVRKYDVMYRLVALLDRIGWPEPLLYQPDDMRHLPSQSSSDLQVT